MAKLWLLFALFLTGCATAKYPSADENFDPRHHAIYVDQFGNIKASTATTVGAASDALAAQADQDERYVEPIIKNFLEKRKTRPDLKFTVFVHGGLNTPDAFWRRATTFSKAMLADGQYPVFVGWNSGPFSNYADHLFRIRKGERRPVLAALSMPFVLVEDIARSIAHIPAAWYMSVMDPLSATKAVEISQEADYKIRRERLKTLEFKVHSDPPYDGTGIGGSYATIINPLKLVTAPFVDGFGAGSWDSMLRRTDLVLSKALAFEGELTNETARDFADTAVTKLLKKIEALSTAVPNEYHTPIRTNLIGHSMGTIIVNNILARHPALNVDNVVFMGAAASIKDVENGVVPWMLRENNGAEFYSLSLDPYLEMGEHTYHDVLPRGSLLHWIDNIFGEVNSFKDRTAGAWWNLIRTAEDVFPTRLRQRVHLTRFAIGKQYGPQRHGDFDDYYFWCESYWTAAGEQAKFEKNEDEAPQAETARRPCTTPSPHRQQEKLLIQ